jgi:hypothetical protein
VQRVRSLEQPVSNLCWFVVPILFSLTPLKDLVQSFQLLSTEPLLPSLETLVQQVAMELTFLAILATSCWVSSLIPFLRRLTSKAPTLCTARSTVTGVIPLPCARPCPALLEHRASCHARACPDTLVLSHSTPFLESTLGAALVLAFGSTFDNPYSCPLPSKR